MILAGFWVIYHYSLIAFGGRDRLWIFEKMEQHRFTAMAMLTGTLKLRFGLSKIGHDEQVFNGAAFTNWGFGVPLLQVPFHALAAKMKTLPQKFFPDRAIYFAYFMAVVPVMWAGFDRLLAMREPLGASKLRRHFLSWATTALVITTTLYPLMSCRFIIYEETICYFQLAQFLALAAYIFAQRSWDAGSVITLGAAAGLGLLIRPTGLIYFGMWSVLVLLEQRKWKTVLTFSGVSPVRRVLGVQQLGAVGIAHLAGPEQLDALVRLPHAHGALRGLLFGHPGAHPGGGVAPVRLVLHRGEARSEDLALAGQVPLRVRGPPAAHRFHLHRRALLRDAGARRARVDDDPPAAKARDAPRPVRTPRHPAAPVRRLRLGRRQLRVALRGRLLAGDHPCGGAVRPLLAQDGPARVRPPLALGFLALSWATFNRSIEPFVSTLETLDEYAANTMWADFTNSRWAQDKPLPSHVKCGEHADWLYHDGQGWLNQCKVDNFTNVFIGVPDKSDDHYQLQFKTEGVSVPTLRVYVNGRIYTARRMGDSYVADVTIHFARLTSPIVMTTIEWTRDLEAPPYKLFSVQLT